MQAIRIASRADAAAAGSLPVTARRRAVATVSVACRSARSWDVDVGADPRPGLRGFPAGASLRDASATGGSTSGCAPGVPAPPAAAASEPSMARSSDCAVPPGMRNRAPSTRTAPVATAIQNERRRAISGTASLSRPLTAVTTVDAPVVRGSRRGSASRCARRADVRGGRPASPPDARVPDVLEPDVSEPDASAPGAPEKMRPGIRPRPGACGAGISTATGGARSKTRDSSEPSHAAGESRSSAE